MAKKLPLRLVRIFTLITIKEGYLTGRNFLGLFLHPFKTITVLSREKDPVQILLFFGLPAYLWIGGVLGIVLGRLLMGAQFLHFGPKAVVSLLLISFISGLLFSYLAFWTFIFLRKKND